MLLAEQPRVFVNLWKNEGELSVPFYSPSASLVPAKWDLPSPPIKVFGWTWHNHQPCVLKMLVGLGSPSHDPRARFQRTSETSEVPGTISSHLWESLNKQLLPEGHRTQGGGAWGLSQRGTGELCLTSPPKWKSTLLSVSDPQPSNRRVPRWLILSLGLARIPTPPGEPGSAD